SENVRTLGVRLARAAARGDIEPAQLDALEQLIDQFLESGKAPALDTLKRSDREDEISLWLEDHDIEEAWELSPTFVGANLGIADLELVEEAVPPGTLVDALRYLEAALDVSWFVDEVEESTARISRLIDTMQGYSFMDRAPTQEVDVNEALDNTLAILAYKLDGIQVEREFDPDLPRITAHGNELNQVWTSLIDNAIDAVAEGEGSGSIRLRTTCEGDRLLVEISDDGPGIPEEIQARIFEPFFTTKDVGKGAGLGLDVSYRIVVGRHGGDLRVVSRPGETRCEVRLPVNAGVGREALVSEG
ncbi:MAG TPA: ATP-binding protein, partial [Rubrobacter sp.]|nr:ATP-binding protein [Rubrobacter sp.]